MRGTITPPIILVQPLADTNACVCACLHPITSDSMHRFSKFDMANIVIREDSFSHYNFEAYAIACMPLHRTIPCVRKGIIISPWAKRTFFLGGDGASSSDSSSPSDGISSSSPSLSKSEPSESSRSASSSTTYMNGTDVFHCTRCECTHTYQRTHVIRACVSYVPSWFLV